MSSLRVAVVILLGAQVGACATTPRPAPAAIDPALREPWEQVARHLTPRALRALESSPLVVRSLQPTSSTLGRLHRAEYDGTTRERRIGVHLLDADAVIVERAILHESIHHLHEHAHLIDATAFARALDEPYNAGLRFRVEAVMTTYSVRAASRPDESMAFAAELITYFDKDVSDGMREVFAEVLRPASRDR